MNIRLGSRLQALGARPETLVPRCMESSLGKVMTTYPKLGVEGTRTDVHLYRKERFSRDAGCMAGVSRRRRWRFRIRLKEHPHLMPWGAILAAYRRLRRERLDLREEQGSR